MSLSPKVLEKLISLPNSSGSTRRIEPDNSTLSRGTGGAEPAKFVRPFWLAASRSPSPLPSPAGRGNSASRAATSPGALDWRKRGGRFSLSPRERAGGRGKQRLKHQCDWRLTPVVLKLRPKRLVAFQNRLG